MIHQRLFPLDMSNLTVAPGFSTLITVGKSGKEARTQTWSQPLRQYDAGFTVRTLDDLRELQEFHLSTRGSLTAFLLQDYTDFAVDTWTEFTETVTGASQTFQLFKTYTDIHGNTYSRNIYFVEEGAVTLQDEGVDVDPGDFTVDLVTGLVTYDASASGATVTFKISKFFVPVRFVEDSLPTDLQYYLTNTDSGYGQVPSIPLIEVRYETVTSEGILLPVPPDTTPPVAVSDLGFVSKTSYSVTMNFTNPTDAVAWQYRVDGGSWATASTSGSTTRQFTASGLDDGVEYDFEVRTADSAGNWSTPSNVLTRTTNTLAISDLTYSSKNTYQITFTFSAVTDASSYQVSTDGGSTWASLSVTGTSTKTGTASELTANTAYTIAVRALDGTNTGATSNTITQTTNSLTAISDLTYSGTRTSSSITYTFTNPTGAAVYQYRLDGGSWVTFTPTGTTTKTFAVSGLSSSTSYTTDVRWGDGKASPNYSSDSNDVTQSTDAPSYTNIVGSASTFNFSSEFASFPASNVNDASAGTIWLSATPSTSEYLEYIWSSAKAIGQYNVQADRIDGTYAFTQTIKYWDGSAYQTIESGVTGSTSATLRSFSEVTTTRIKIEFSKGSSGYMQVQTVKIMGV